MFRIIRIQLIALLLISTFWACTDHQLRPSSPARLRLKTTMSANTDGTTTQTSFEYDAQNRLVAYSQGDIRGTITYDAQNQYHQIDETRPTGLLRTRFTYQPTAQGKEVTTIVYRVVPVDGRELELLSELRKYGFDANNRITTSFSEIGQNNPATQVNTTYSYTGDNITAATITYRFGTRKYAYQYDDKPNPFYGLIGPGIDEVRRFSRNNFTKFTDATFPPDISSTYTYEYNAQGLPTKIDNLTLTYESY